MDPARLNRMTAAVFLTGVWLASPLAIGVASADRSADRSADSSADSSASDSASSDGSVETTPRSAQRDAAPSVEDDASESETGEAEPVIAIDPPEPVETIKESLPEPEPVEEAEPVETVEESLPEPEPVEEAEPVETVEESLPEPEPVGATEAVTEAAPDTSAESTTDPATENTGEDGVGGRGGGLTPLPFWRGAVGDPQPEGDPEPVAMESTSIDPGQVPDAPALDVVNDPPVYYFGDVMTDQSDPPVLTSDSPRSALGPGTLVEAVATGINRILDTVSGWISGLPAGPLQDFLAGVLLLVRNALPQDWVKPTRVTSDGTGQMIDEDDGTDGTDDDVLDGLTGLSESDAGAAAGELGLTVRVVARDGEYFPVTKDYRTDRVNFVVEDGVVVEAKIG